VSEVHVARAPTRLTLVLALALAPIAAAAREGAAVPIDPGAAADARVEVVAPRCPNVPFEFGAFLSILRAELRAVPYDVALAAPDAGAPNSAATDGGGSFGTGAGEARGPILTLEIVPCDPATVAVEATYENQRANRRVHKRVDLTDVERERRARVLSLVLAEWLREAPNLPVSAGTAFTHVVAIASPDRAPAPPERPSSSAPRSAASDGGAGERAVGGDAAVDWSQRHLSLSLAAAARAYRGIAAGGSATSVAGGRAGATLRAGATPLRFAFDVSLLVGTSQLAIGSVDVRALAASAGIDLVAGGRRATLTVGPRFEVGWGSIAGHSDDPTVRSGQVAGPLAGVSLAGSLGVRVTPAFEPFLEVDGGVTLAEVVGLSDGTRAAGFTGAWIATCVGARVGL
jgi:hypothetical protein